MFLVTSQLIRITKAVVQFGTRHNSFRANTVSWKVTDHDNNNSSPIHAKITKFGSQV